MTVFNAMQLVDLFGSTRDEWMAEDLNAWLAPNRIYSGTADAVKKLMKDQEAYIVTTKQARFTKTILEQMAGIEFPMERIFSQTVSGRPKSEVLQDLQSKHPEASCHFVEDKLSTLEKVSAVPVQYNGCFLYDFQSRFQRFIVETIDFICYQ